MKKSLYKKIKSLLNFNFVMIYIIHKMLVLLKNHLNCFRDSIFECFFKEYNRLLSFFFQKKKKNMMMENIMMESLRLEEENIIKDIRNYF